MRKAAAFRQSEDFRSVMPSRSAIDGSFMLNFLGIVLHETLSLLHWLFGRP